MYGEENNYNCKENEVAGNELPVHLQVHVVSNFGNTMA